MDLYNDIMADPFLQGLVVAIVGSVGAGVALIWRAATRAIVRALDQVANDDDDEVETVRKVRQHNSLMRTIPATFIADQAKLRHSTRPPGGEV